MPALAHAIAARLAGQFLAHERLDLPTVRVRDAGHGFDRLGAEPLHAKIGLAIFWLFYRHYFRVISNGAEHIPRDGAAIIVSNHSGTIPIDAMMLWTDVLLRTGRLPRTVADRFVPALPFVWTFFARGGVVSGTPENLAALLESGELAVVFPEGVPGISKPFWRRYQLAPWRPGHAEAALRHRVPIVPAAVIGAEEQLPQLARLVGLGHRLGLPHLPIPAVPLPLPVRYHILYGPPLRLYERYPASDAERPAVVASAAAEVNAAVRKLVGIGLARRKGVFA